MGLVSQLPQRHNAALSQPIRSPPSALRRSETSLGQRLPLVIDTLISKFELVKVLSEKDDIDETLLPGHGNATQIYLSVLSISRLRCKQ